MLAAVALAAPGSPLVAAETIVAVASNFVRPAEEIAAAFSAATGHPVVLSLGATGALYAQISQGAPFAVFLAADEARPREAEAASLAVEDTVFTYAIGRLVLYSRSLNLEDGASVLRNGSFEHLAIAEPGAAPYGAAAMEVLAALDLVEATAPRIVTGENVGQTLQFVDSGNAELGFVALSQVQDRPASEFWVVPDEWYTPIRQDAVLLEAGRGDPVARSFVEFLKGETARAVIVAHGYDVAE